MSSAIATIFFRLQWDNYIYNFNVLVQERCNSIANALELHLSCTNHRFDVHLFVYFFVYIIYM